MSKIEGLIIRDMARADVDAMAEIALEAWTPIFRSFESILGEPLFRSAYPNWRSDKERQIRSTAAPGSGVRFLVAEIEGRAVGFVSWRVHAESGIAEIGNNAVRPAEQCRGIAQELYGEVFRRCRAEGVRTAKVTTGLDASHAPARRAYQKAGFSSGIPMITYYRSLEEP